MTTTTAELRYAACEDCDWYMWDHEPWVDSLEEVAAGHAEEYRDRAYVDSVTIQL